MRTRPALALTLALLAGGPASAEEACPRAVSVVGRAASTQVPDFAEIDVGVEARGASPAAALDAASKAVAGIQALAREAGVAQADIGTAAVVLVPATRTVTRPGGTTAQEPDGYRASNLVSLRLADMGRLGDLLRRTLDAGANRIDSVRFGLREPGKVEAALQAEAARDARARAAALAEAVGARLGPLCTLTAGASPPERPMARALAAPPPRGRSVPVEAGTIETAAEVSATFGLAP